MSESENKEQIKRFEFAFDEEGVQRVEELRKRSGDNSAVLMRNALMLYEWYLDHRDKGNSLGIVKQGKFYQVDLKFD